MGLFSSLFQSPTASIPIIYNPATDSLEDKAHTPIYIDYGTWHGETLRWQPIETVSLPRGGHGVRVISDNILDYVDLKSYESWFENFKREVNAPKFVQINPATETEFKTHFAAALFSEDAPWNIIPTRGGMKLVKATCDQGYWTKMQGSCAWAKRNESKLSVQVPGVCGPGWWMLYPVAGGYAPLLICEDKLGNMNCPFIFPEVKREWCAGVRAIAILELDDVEWTKVKKALVAKTEAMLTYVSDGDSYEIVLPFHDGNVVVRS